MPQRFSDPFAAVRTLAQRRSGMFDPAKERRRVTALERSARAGSDAGGFRPPTASAAPACDDATYGSGVTVYSDAGADRLQMCLTTEAGEFASRPLAFADEQLVQGFASSGNCNASQTLNGATAQTISVNVGTQYQWQCLITGSVTGGGDMDIRLDGPVTTGWHNAGREADTNGSGNHSHSISGSGNHDHGIASVGSHDHSIANEAAHQHGIGQGGAHSHSIPNSGGHSHTIDSGGQHSHSVQINDQGNHRHNSQTPVAGLHSHPAGTGNSGTHSHGMGNAGNHNHGGTDSSGSHTHGGGTTGAGGGHNHGGSTGNAGSHDHGGSTGNGGNHDHGGSTGNAGNHTHTVEANASGTVARVANVSGNNTVRLEFRSASSKQARCYSAALTAVCWRVG